MTITRIVAPITVSAALALCAPAQVSAKVIFTGYADLRFVPYGETVLSVAPALQTAFKIPENRVKDRGFTLDSIGFFASTYFNDQLGFSTDITYRQIGYKTNEIRLQYAYLFYDHPSRFSVHAGKITLPFGYYNQHYFYPFQRKSVSPPVFQSAILGLPIGDAGVKFVQKLGAEPFGVELSAYAINGYGSSDAAGTSFRPGLGATNALVVANNLNATNDNGDLAYGENITFKLFRNESVKLGSNLYYGPWSKDGQRDLLMVTGYGAAELGRFDFLAEYLYTKTENDNGVIGFYGIPDWESNGFFVESSYLLYKNEQKTLHAFAGAEYTQAEGNRGGSGKEILRNYKAGAAFKLNDFVTLKTELSRLEYAIPIQLGGSAQNLSIDRNGIALNLVVTY